MTRKGLSLQTYGSLLVCRCTIYSNGDVRSQTGREARAMMQRDISRHKFNCSDRANMHKFRLPSRDSSLMYGLHLLYNFNTDHWKVKLNRYGQQTSQESFFLAKEDFGSLAQWRLEKVTRSCTIFYFRFVARYSICYYVSGEQR